MKDFYVKHASSLEGHKIESCFLVASKQVRRKKNGEPYLALILTDSTGSIDAKVWDNLPAVQQSFEENDFVRVRGWVGSYNQRPEIVVGSLERVAEDTIDPTDFFPKTSWDIDELWLELEAFVGKMRNPHLRALLESFVGDKEIARLLRLAPAAKSLHHAYLGGLLEHVVSLCTLSELITVRYFWLDRDLLIAGAILHDIGKIYELTYTRAFGYTIEGMLIGHISIGLAMLQQKARRVPELPKEALILLEHLILSHHGRLEYGSPVEPRFPEAVLLHVLDDLDAKMEAMRAALESDSSISQLWSARVHSLGYPVLDARRFLDRVSDLPQGQ